MLRSASLAYAAGLVGALAAALALWAAGRYGLNAKLQVAIAPPLSLHWLYPRLIIGGLFGLQLLLPLSRQLIVRGMVLSIAPTLLILLWIFPFEGAQGWFGLKLGLLTPLVVWTSMLVGSGTAVLWSRATGL